MRLAACALSAVLLSGCSWLGLGGQSNGYGTSDGAYGANCAPVQSMSYGQSASYGAAYGTHGAAGCAGGAYGVGQGYGAGYGADGHGAFAGTQGYGPAGAGYGAGAYGAAGNGYGQAGYAQQAGYGAGGFGAGGATGFGQAGYGAGAYGAGANGVAGFGPGAVGAGLAAQGIGGAYGAGTYGTAGVYGANGVTTLGAAAPYGAAAYGSNVVGTQLSNGQYVNGAQVQNVVGAPIYVPQPYAAPYGVPQLRGVGAAMPFGVEVFGGSEFDVDGVLFPAKTSGPSLGGGGIAGGFDEITYADAFSDGKTIGGAATYDISRNTTLIGSAAFSKKEGQSVSTGSFESGVTDPVTGVFTPDVGATARDLTGTFSDLEQYTIEGGVRQYVGNNTGLRPYVGASAGFAYNNDVNLTQTYNDDGTLFNDQQFIENGWRPTAAGVVGAEMAVGPRSAIGVETGLRWRDNLKANTGGEDRLSIPVKLRGRLAF